MMKYNTQFPLAVLLFMILCWNVVEARRGTQRIDGRRLRGLKEGKEGGKAKNQKNNMQQMDKVQNEEDRNFGVEENEDEENEDETIEELLNCLSDNMQSEPFKVISAFGLVSCTGELISFFNPGIIGNPFERQEDEVKEELTSLLNCVGAEVGCDGGDGEEGGQEDEDNGQEEQEEDPEQEGDNDPLIDCIREGVQGDSSTVTFNFNNPFDCIGDFGQLALDDVMTCIGESIGCSPALDPEVIPDPEEEDRNDGPGDKIPLPLPPQDGDSPPGLVPGLPDGEDRNDGPGKVPLPLYPGDNGADPGLVPLSESASKTLGDVFDSMFP